MKDKMQAWRIEQNRLEPAEMAVPLPQAGEVLIEVAYAGVNRADLFQVAGQYPAPVETAMVPGLEVSGRIAACGDGVTEWKSGDRICALLQGGGYAPYCVAPADQLLPVPETMRLKDAAALPEGLATVWLALMRKAQLKPGEQVLINGGTSGIGTLAIQVANCLNTRSITTAGSPEKMAFCESLGAHSLNYHSPEFVSQTMALTGGKGIDVAIDMFGGPWIDRIFEAMAPGGRLISIAFLQGANVPLQAGRLLIKNLSWQGMTLRSQPFQEKAAILAELQARLGSELASGRIKPVIDTVFALENVEKAHSRMQERLHIGKILLEVGAQQNI